MLSNNTNFQLITPLKLMLSKDVFMAVLPGQEGNLGIMFKHTPLLTLLNRGIVELYDESNKLIDSIIVDGGVAEVTETSVVILSERAENFNDLNKHHLEEKLLNSEKQVNHQDKDISSLASKQSDFYKFVLEKVN